MTMPNADRAYDDLIEISARIIAVSNLTGRALQRRVHQLISEAADLRGAWDKYSAKGPPGSADLPIVDEIIDEAYSRAASLRGEIFGEVRLQQVDSAAQLLARRQDRVASTTDASEVRYAGTTDVSEVRVLARDTKYECGDYAGTTDVSGLVAQVHELLGRVRNGH
jgi:hypothetical protein